MISRTLRAALLMFHSVDLARPLAGSRMIERCVLCETPFTFNAFVENGNVAGMPALRCWVCHVLAGINWYGDGSTRACIAGLLVASPVTFTTPCCAPVEVLNS